MGSMTEHIANSIVIFWGGVDSAKSLCRSYLDPSLTEERKREVMKNYHINQIFEALDYLGVDYG